MTFPTIAAPSTALLGPGTAHNVPMPGSTANTRLITVVTTTSQPVTTPGGWTLKRALSVLGSGSVTLYINVYAKVADGTEGGTTVNFATAVSDYLGYAVYYASDAGYTLANIAVSTGATGTSTTPDSDSLTSGFGAVDTTWISAMVAQTNTISAYPASYGNTATVFFGFGELGVADRDVNGASQNPGSYTLGGSFAWAALTIGISLNVGVTPVVTSVTPDEFPTSGLAGVVIAGSNFKATQSTGGVYIQDGPDWDSIPNFRTASLTVSSWATGSITVTLAWPFTPPAAAYLFVENSDGNHSNAIPVYPYETMALAAAKGVGAQPLGVEVYDPGGSTSLGFVSEIMQADTDEAINEIGAFGFTVPAAGNNVALLTPGREVKLYRETEGQIFYGVIDSAEKAVANNQRVLVVKGSGLDDELARANTYRGTSAIVEDATTYLDPEITAEGWTLLDNVFGSKLITKQFENVSKYAMAVDVAEIVNGFIRSTSTKRQLEIRASSKRTGIRLRTLESVTAEIVENPAIGLVESVKVRKDASQVFNRIVAEAKTDGERIFGLQQSTRSSPYTIQSLLLRPANAFSTKVDRLLSGGGGGLDYLQIGGVDIAGENRMFFAFIALFVNSTAWAPNVLNVDVGGVAMDQVFSRTFTPEGGTLGSGTLYGYYLLNPPKMSNGRVFVQADTGGMACYGAFYSLRDVDQLSPIRQIGTPAQGSGTSTSITLTDAIVDDLMIDGIIQHDSVAGSALTAGSGQTPANLLLTFQNMAESFKRRNGSNTMSWSWTGTKAYAQGALAIKPYRTYYIEDAASVAAYGRRVKILAMGDFKPQGSETVADAMDTMYDKAVDYLLKHKDAIEFRDLAVASLAQSPVDWNVGDSLLDEVEDPLAGITAGGWKICTRRRATYDGAGFRKWTLTLSDVFRNPEDDVSLMASMQARISQIQSNQV